jgi:hypothetical protein
MSKSIKFKDKEGNDVYLTSQVYSINKEQKIGWCENDDGTLVPLYRKVISTRTGSDVSTAITLDTISNMKDLIQLTATWTSSDSFRYYTPDKTESPILFINPQGEVCESHKSSYFNKHNIKIIVLYTKTTD